jgi:hypothetical protein
MIGSGFPWLALVSCILVLGAMVLLSMLLALKTRRTRGPAACPNTECAEENARHQRTCIRCGGPLL